MKKLLTTLPLAASALVLMLGLSLAIPSANADAARWSKTYRTLSQCNTARNASLGTGYRGYIGKCQAIGSSSASSGSIIGYAFKKGY